MSVVGQNVLSALGGFKPLGRETAVGTASPHETEKKRTLRNWNGSERSKLAAFHAPILAPDVITREIDVFPAEG
jgi:hypothetical protein